MNTFTYIIQDEAGLHARPASQLVKYLEGVTSSVSVKKGEKTADAKRLFSLMGLAIKFEEEIEFTLDGDNAPTEAAALEQFCKENF